MSDVGLRLVLAWSASWLAFGLVSGWWANRWSLRRCGRDSRVTRLRDWERSGRCYKRVGIKRWKGLLPEAGDFYRGGMSKRRLPGGSAAVVARFVAETRRAERVHWMNAAWGLTFLLWSPWQIALGMIVFGVVVHSPFIMIQRYNRARALRVLERARRRARPAVGPAAGQATTATGAAELDLGVGPHSDPSELEIGLSPPAPA